MCWAPFLSPSPPSFPSTSHSTLPPPFKSPTSYSLHIFIANSRSACGRRSITMSAAFAAAAAAALLQKRYNNRSGNSTSTSGNSFVSYSREVSPPRHSRYESQKLRDWNMFRLYLKNHRPALTVSLCSGVHVIDFLRYLDVRFGKIKVHNRDCPLFNHSHTIAQSNPSSSCACPVRQAWGSLDAIVGRLRAAFEENGGLPETNPFRARVVRLYLNEVRDSQEA